MSIPRDHHFVPVFYLKRWTDGTRLIEFAKKNGRIVSKSVGPRLTGFQRDLYSFNGLPETIATHLESVFLQRNDGTAALVMRMLLGEARLSWTGNLRSSWSRFLMGFLIRHPDPFAELREAVDEKWLVADADTEAEYQKLRSPDLPATFADYLNADKEGLGDKIQIRLLQAAMDNEPLGKRINRLRWATLDMSRSNVPLLTSDWPLMNSLTDRGGYVSLPLSPTALFVAAHDEQFIAQLRSVSPTAVARMSNKNVVQLARRFVWSADRQQRQFIEKHFGVSAKTPPFFPALKR